MIASFSKLRSSRKVEDKKINSVFVLNDHQQLVQISFHLVRPKPKTFTQKISFRLFGKKSNDLRDVIFVGNQQTPQTRAANKHYYEKVLKLKENNSYKVKDILYEESNSLERLEQEERQVVFSVN